MICHQCTLPHPFVWDVVIFIRPNNAINSHEPKTNMWSFWVEANCAGALSFVYTCIAQSFYVQALETGNKASIWKESLNCDGHQYQQNPRYWRLL
jgi:hypothetical protein